MVQTFIQGSALTSNINQDQRVIDMSEEIAFKAPRISPFLFLAQRPSMPYGNPETGAKTVSFNLRGVFNTTFKWLEDELRDMSTTTSAQIADATTLWVAVTNVNIFQLGDIVDVVPTGEILRVDEIDTVGLQIKVTRGWGTTAAAAASATNNTLLIIGNVNAENARSRPTSDILTTTKQNYIQTTRNPFDGSDKTQQTQLYGIQDYRMYKRNTKFLEHLYNIESSLLFGQPFSGTEYQGSSPEIQTGGVLYFVNQNVQDMGGGALTKADFEDWLADAFDFGSDEKFLFCGKAVSKAISKFAGDTSSAPVSTVYVQNLATTFGIKIRTYQSDNGIVHIIRHGLLKGDTYKGYGILIDPKFMRMARLKKGDWFKMYPDIQENDRAGWKDEYRTDFGLELRLPINHGLLTGVGG